MPLTCVFLDETARLTLLTTSLDFSPRVPRLSARITNEITERIVSE